MSDNLDPQYQKIIENNLENYNNLLAEERNKNAILSQELIEVKRQLIELKQQINNSNSGFVVIGKRPIDLPKNNN